MSSTVKRKLGIAAVVTIWLAALALLLLDLSSFNACGDNMDFLCRDVPGYGLTDVLIWFGFALATAAVIFVLGRKSSSKIRNGKK